MYKKSKIVLFAGEDESAQIGEILRPLYEIKSAREAGDFERILSGGGYFLAIVGEGSGFSALKALEIINNNGVPALVMAFFHRPDPKRDAELIDKGIEACLQFPIEPSYLRSLVERARKRTGREERIRTLTDQLRALYLSILGYDCPGMESVERIVNELAQNDEPFLLIGEKGAGKELLARAIHLAGRRALSPFEVVNARHVVDKSTIMKKLFGAPDCDGALDKATRGALLIHGIGEVPVDVQERLVDVINDRRRDVRLIFTTRLDLHGAVLREEFSSRLWEILEANMVHVAPLRERPQAIITLAQRLIERYAERLLSPVRFLHESAKQALLSHSWDGNLLEMERVIVAGISRASGPLLVAEDLLELNPSRESPCVDELSFEEIMLYKLKPLVNTLDDLEDTEFYDMVMSKVERPLLKLVLDKMDGNQVRTAKVLGIHRNTLRNKIAKLNLAPKK